MEEHDPLIVRVYFSFEKHPIPLASSRWEGGKERCLEYVDGTSCRQHTPNLSLLPLRDLLQVQVGRGWGKFTPGLKCAFLRGALVFSIRLVII